MATAVYSTLIYFYNFVMTSPLALVKNGFELFRLWWAGLGPEPSAIEQITAFGREFNTQYDAKIPWLNCSYYSAVSSIRTGLRPVIVFLANGQKSGDNALFAQSIINAHEEMKDRVQFWGVDISSAEGVRTAETIFVHSFPSLLIIGLKNNQQNVLFRTCSPRNSLTQLAAKIHTAEAELVTVRHEAEIRDMDRRLREEQDLEFQRTVELDRKRLEQEKREQEAEVEKLRAAEERETERQRRHTEHRDRRISARNTLAPEPKTGGICIQFKLPDGSRHPRKFEPDSSIQDVFLFVQSLDASPASYYLSSVYPVRKITADTLGTLSTLGIQNNEQLMVQSQAEFSSDDEDEDDDDSVDSS